MLFLRTELSSVRFYLTRISLVLGFRQRIFTITESEENLKKLVQTLSVFLFSLILLHGMKAKAGWMNEGAGEPSIAVPWYSSPAVPVIICAVLAGICVFMVAFVMRTSKKAPE
ncbi:MAG: hypothetical protein AAB515_02750 [Patescibacteria group bacterium]